MNRRFYIYLRYDVYLTADDIDDIVGIVAIVDIVAFTGYAVHSQCMLCNLAQHCKSRSLSANWIGMK